MVNNTVKKFAYMLLMLVILIGFYYLSLQTYMKLWFGKFTEFEFLAPVLELEFRGGIILHDLTSLVFYTLLFGLVFRKNIYKQSDLSAMTGKTTGIIVLLGIFMGLWMMSFVRFPFIADNFPQFKEAFDFLLGKSIWFFVVFWVVHSFYKEIFFRGLIFNEMQRVLPTWLSIFILGIIYGALFFNLDPILSSYGMLGAVILCLVYIWQKSIWTTIVAEFVLFSTYFVYHNLNPAFGWVVVLLFIVSTPVILYLMYILWKTRVTATASADASGKSAGLNASAS